MIVSASRRTDIPAHFAPWFLERVRAGWTMVANPMNPRQVRRVDLTPAAVDGFVCWTKNPLPMLPVLKELAGEYAFVFQFTLNAYGPDVEPGVPEPENRVEALRQLADILGPERVEWRYDPILVSPDYPAEFHLRAFERLARQIAPSARGCTVSFVDFYRGVRKRLAALGAVELDLEQRSALALALADIAAAQNLPIRACCEAGLPLPQAHCVQAADFGLPENRDPHQRPACGCARSVDIGAYRTCPAGCAYCYATGGRGPGKLFGL